MHIVWSEEEREYVRTNCGTLTDKQIADELSKKSGRVISIQAARKQRQKMGIKKKHGRGVCQLVDESPVVRKPKGMSLHIRSEIGDS